MLGYKPSRSRTKKVRDIIYMKTYYRNFLLANTLTMNLRYLVLFLLLNISNMYVHNGKPPVVCEYVFIFGIIFEYALIEWVPLWKKTTKWWCIFFPVIVFTRMLPICLIMVHEKNNLFLNLANIKKFLCYIFLMRPDLSLESSFLIGIWGVCALISMGKTLENAYTLIGYVQYYLYITKGDSY